MADEEQTTSENDPVVEENTQAEQEQTEPAPEQQQASASHEHRNQWIFFGILVGILIGVVLVIAVLRPLIFDRIVPAVMGDFNTPIPATVEETAPAEDQPASEESAPVEESAETDEDDLFVPAAVSGESAEASESESEPVAAETAVPPESASEPVTHTVQVGDNLTKISQQYGVSVQEIMAANSLTNADYISVGQVLIIPTQ